MKFALAKHYVDGLRLAPEIFDTIKEAWDWGEEKLGGIHTHVVQIGERVDEEEYVVSTFHTWFEHQEPELMGKSLDELVEQFKHIEFYTRERIKKAMDRYDQERAKGEPS